MSMKKCHHSTEQIKAHNTADYWHIRLSFVGMSSIMTVNLQCTNNKNAKNNIWQ